MNRCLANCTHFEPPQRFKGTIQMSNSKIVQFHSKNIELATVNNQLCITQVQLGHALGYTRGDVVGQLFKAHADEFTPDMTCTSDLLVQGQMRKVRVFSLRGCHLLAMFSKTPVAKEFRRWVLDLIEAQTVPAPAVDKSVVRSALYDYMGEVMLNEEMLPKWRALFQRWMKDVIFSEDYFGALKKLMIPWVRDAFKGGNAAVWNDFIAMGLETRVNALLEAKKKELAKEINKLLM